MLGIVLSFHDCKPVWGRYDCCSHFTDEKGEALRGYAVTVSKSLRQGLHQAVQFQKLLCKPLSYSVTLFQGVMAGTYGSKKIWESWKV